MKETEVNRIQSRGDNVENADPHILSVPTTWHPGYNLHLSKIRSRGKELPRNKRKQNLNKGFKNGWLEPKKKPVILLLRK